jgi:hypothetical protein
MALNNFFKINLPYGIAKNMDGEWMAFNREYMPLGYSQRDHQFHIGENNEAPIYSKYKGLTDNFLVQLGDTPKDIQRNDKGEIIKVFLYDDGSNPSNHKPSKKDLWERYFSKLEKLSKLNI